METIKIKKWDSKKIYYACDKWDKMDMCFYIWGDKIKIDPTTEDSEEGVENTFDITEEMSDELDIGEHKASIRLNGEWRDKIKIIITNPEEDDKDDENE